MNQYNDLFMLYNVIYTFSSDSTDGKYKTFLMYDRHQTSNWILIQYCKSKALNMFISIFMDELHF
jgi:hypothetical protein